MIVLIIYIIGIFITPIILKRFFSPFEIEDIESVISFMCICWPLVLVTWLMFKLFSIFIYIYNKTPGRS